MPSASATITGKTGPGNTLTAYALAGITNVNIDIMARTLTVFYGSGQSLCIDYAQTVTLTDTISGTVSTFTIT